jgi:hypothetical protein
MRATLKIENARVGNHDQALQLLETVANSVFFELDLRYNVALSLYKIPPYIRLRRTQPDGQRPTSARPVSEISSEIPHVPRNSYPAKPLALYWYARSAVNMPLLQYLASYQVLEYHFPIYYERETLDRD